MAKLYSRKRGKSSSKKHLKPEEIKTSSVKKKEIIDLIKELANKGMTEAQIGLVLKTKHDIPSVKATVGKRISQILKEEGVERKYPSDLLDLIKKAVKLRRHSKENKKDKHNNRNLLLIESKIKRLVRYYRGNKLPDKWKYDSETAELLVK
ncbi:30S ribosomal protein S15 [uncultured archaeon]|nr:30S ribosomal protein S15 [uncultured archaeon]